MVYVTSDRKCPIDILQMSKQSSCRCKCRCQIDVSMYMCHQSIFGAHLSQPNSSTRTNCCINVIIIILYYVLVGKNSIFLSCV